MTTVSGSVRTHSPFVAALLAVVSLCAASHAQYGERGDLHGSGGPGLDVSGRSIKNPRVRAVHTTDPDLEGGTAYFLAKDPFLAYQLGRNLTLREFRSRDGIFNDTVADMSGPMVDGTTRKNTFDNQTSCGGCHNVPYGNPGAGVTFAKDSGRGRNTPHFFGAGLMEMLSQQIRAELMELIDVDGDGWVSAAEAGSAPPLLVETTPGGELVDFGSAAVAEGVPGLNRIFRVWYGIEGPPGTITIAPDADGIDGVDATHYNFEMVLWGWGQRTPPSALNPTNRAFLLDPFVTHFGLDAHDPTTLDDPDGDGVSEPSLAGAIQFPATHRPPDMGVVLDSFGFSHDDPDGDGHLTEISEGDLDLAEWFMLNAPRPAFAGTEKDFKRGLKLLEKTGCTECHVADWTLAAQDEIHAGDRRFFDLDVRWEKIKKDGRLVGALVPLYDVVGDTYEPRREAFDIVGLFTDLRQHEMGEGFAEMAYDGNVNTMWRTPPLWGVGSTYPWGHDGASLTLEDVIRRHGGEAAESAKKFAKSSRGRRSRIIDFLSKLVLYDIETMPTDMDGDGVVSESFVVAGVDTGPERFNPEWLFRTPVQIQGEVINHDGHTVRSDAAANLTESYGLDLPLRIDSDLDGWPDVWDGLPLSPGFKDGVQN